MLIICTHTVYTMCPDDVSLKRIVSYPQHPSTEQILDELCEKLNNSRSRVIELAIHAYAQKKRPSFINRHDTRRVLDYLMNSWNRSEEEVVEVCLHHMYHTENLPTNRVFGTTGPVYYEKKYFKTK